MGKLAEITSVGQEMVIRAVQELCYFGATKLLPIFLWTNMYRCTPRFGDVYKVDALRDSAKDIANRNVPEDKRTDLRPVLDFMCDLKHNVEIGQVMSRHKNKLPENFRENLPHLIQFAVSHGLIMRCVYWFFSACSYAFLNQSYIFRVHRYPYFNQESFRAAGGEKLNADQSFSVAGDAAFICSVKQMRDLFDGKRQFDAIGALLGVTHKELSDFVEKEVHVNVVCK